MTSRPQGHDTAPSIHSLSVDGCRHRPDRVRWVQQTSNDVEGEGIVRRRIQRGWARVVRASEEGMTTAEYAVGTLAAVAFAVVLLAVVRSGAVKAALASVITTALGMGG